MFVASGPAVHWSFERAANESTNYFAFTALSPGLSGQLAR